MFLITLITSPDGCGDEEIEIDLNCVKYETIEDWEIDILNNLEDGEISQSKLSSMTDLSYREISVTEDKTDSFACWRKNVGFMSSEIVCDKK